MAAVQVGTVAAVRMAARAAGAKLVTEWVAKAIMATMVSTALASSALLVRTWAARVEAAKAASVPTAIGKVASVTAV